jgi:hypothetical protein
MSLLGSLKSLYSFLTLSLESKFPSFSARRGIAQIVVIGTIVAIIIVGGIVVYIVATSTGVTTTTYP